MDLSPTSFHVSLENEGLNGRIHPRHRSTKESGSIFTSQSIANMHFVEVRSLLRGQTSGEIGTLDMVLVSAEWAVPCRALPMTSWAVRQPHQPSDVRIDVMVRLL